MSKQSLIDSIEQTESKLSTLKQQLKEIDIYRPKIGETIVVTGKTNCGNDVKIGDIAVFIYDDYSECPKFSNPRWDMGYNYIYLTDVRPLTDKELGR